MATATEPAARYGLYQEDARKDGFDDCAERSTSAGRASRTYAHVQRLIDRLLGRSAGRKSKPARRPPQKPATRRRDPDYATLPGGDSIKEAAAVPADRARELAD
jgi:hypothetical protein